MRRLGCSAMTLLLMACTSQAPPREVAGAAPVVTASVEALDMPSASPEPEPPAPALEPAVGSGQEPASVVPLRPFTTVAADYGLSAPARLTEARRSKREVVERLFARADVAFPPAELLLRGFKQERELEVWASSEVGEAMTQVATYTICATSGDLGPKRQEGDGQVPEGYYRIAYLWPKSDFYLAMKVSYPNVSDRRLGHPTMPGSDIMIHGGCASIGCLAMSDERIQELYLMGAAVQRRSPIAVHLYPTRKRSVLDELPQIEEHRAFWDNLYEGQAIFERTRRPPRVEVDIRGRYRFEET